MNLPKYKYLITYRLAEITYDLTVALCSRFLLSNSLSNLGNLGTLGVFPNRRTADQMIQASRSEKQNIIEAVSEIASLKSQIKLLGISYASGEELTADFEDFLRRNNLKIYQKDDPRITRFRQIGRHLSSIGNLSHLGNQIEKPVLLNNPEEAANFILTLLHQLSYLLKQQILQAEKKFINQGSYSEQLFQKRLDKRNESKG